MDFYMIMPVGSDLRFAEKKAIIDNEAEKNGLRSRFPPITQDNPDFDLDPTMASITESGFVLADLSLERPSCYFELGLAQAMGKSTFLIAETDTPIHQARGRSGIRFYNGLDQYQEIVSSILREQVNKSSRENHARNSAGSARSPYGI